MSEAKHTPGPIVATETERGWWIEGTCGALRTRIAIVDDGAGIASPAANARRLADCWTACNGMPDPSAEIARLRAINADLAEALEALTDRCEMVLRGVAEYSELPGLVHAARAALEKAGVKP